MNLLCPNALDCECTENPFMNLSIEPPDQPEWPAQWWEGRDCHSWCVSYISQADADECARRLALICDNGGGSLECNDPVTVCVSCPV